MLYSFLLTLKSWNLRIDCFGLQMTKSKFWIKQLLLFCAKNSNSHSYLSLNKYIFLEVFLKYTSNSHNYNQIRLNEEKSINSIIYMLKSSFIFIYFTFSQSARRDFWYQRAERDFLVVGHFLPERQYTSRYTRYTRVYLPGIPGILYVLLSRFNINKSTRKRREGLFCLIVTRL